MQESFYCRESSEITALVNFFIKAPMEKKVGNTALHFVKNIKSV